MIENFLREDNVFWSNPPHSLSSNSSHPYLFFSRLHVPFKTHRFHVVLPLCAWVWGCPPDLEQLIRGHIWRKLIFQKKPSVIYNSSARDGNSGVPPLAWCTHRCLKVSCATFWSHPETLFRHVPLPPWLLQSFCSLFHGHPWPFRGGLWHRFPFRAEPSTVFLRPAVG